MCQDVLWQWIFVIFVPLYLILENGSRKILYLRMLILTVSVINTVLSGIYCWKTQLIFFAVAESKIESIFNNAQFRAPDYVMHRQDLSTSSGCLLVYVRGDIPRRRVKLVEINSDGFESLCIEVKNRKYEKPNMLCLLAP